MKVQGEGENQLNEINKIGNYIIKTNNTTKKIAVIISVKAVKQKTEREYISLTFLCTQY